jgi:hypothetical protein
MSLFSAIAHEGATRTKGFWSKRMRVIVVGVVVASVVGVVAVNIGQPEATSTTSLTPALESVAPATGAIGAAVNPFIEANTNAIDWVVPAVAPPSMRGDAFISANTTGMEYPATPYTERWNGPR